MCLVVAWHVPPRPRPPTCVISTLRGISGRYGAGRWEGPTAVEGDEAGLFEGGNALKRGDRSCM